MEFNEILNRLPASTWSWLKINEASFNGCVRKTANTLPKIQRLPGGVCFEENVAPLSGFAGGLGNGMEKILDALDAPHLAIAAACGANVTEPVLLHLDVATGGASYVRQTIKAKANSCITVIMDYTSPIEADGFHAVQTRLYAEEGAKIHLVKVQMLGSGFIHLDDTGCVCGKNAHISITQLELGSLESYVGVQADLVSDGAHFKSDTAYMCRGKQKLDMNYNAIHTGKKTDCQMQVKGILRNEAQKTYRGTIDFRKGCAGSTGNEQEETLLLSSGVINKSIPLILCKEEDVAGEHGASIGRISEDVMFYMNARGVNMVEAERMVSMAKIQSVLRFIPDDHMQKKVTEYIYGAF